MWHRYLQSDISKIVNKLSKSEILILAKLKFQYFFIQYQFY